ncbi:hypothetical protein [Nocardioides flavescens]|uniref:Uncharacterized protein n=1 Tax=Nocardioides flavescens TaxID=2691959 RepID=A0A6L7ESR1_9ACTN|nr:hypothetical protein [Nocardioides flavescens]MXG89710.1 hypothetical protein [Nocardioides flavescens]
MTEKPLDDDDMTTSATDGAGAGSEGSADGVDAGPGPDTGPMDTSDADAGDSESEDGVDAGDGPEVGPKDAS